MKKKTNSADLVSPFVLGLSPPKALADPSFVVRHKNWRTRPSVWRVAEKHERVNIFHHLFVGLLITATVLASAVPSFALRQEPIAQAKPRVLSGLEEQLTSGLEEDRRLDRLVRDLRRKQSEFLSLVPSDALILLDLMRYLGDQNLYGQYIEGDHRSKIYPGRNKAFQIAELAQQRWMRRLASIYVGNSSLQEEYSFDGRMPTGITALRAILSAVLQPGDLFAGLNLLDGGQMGEAGRSFTNIYRRIDIPVTRDGHIDYQTFRTKLLRMPVNRRPRLLLIQGTAFVHKIDHEELWAIVKEVNEDNERKKGDGLPRRMLFVVDGSQTLPDMLVKNYPSAIGLADFFVTSLRHSHGVGAVILARNIVVEEVNAHMGVKDPHLRSTITLAQRVSGDHERHVEGAVFPGSQAGFSVAQMTAEAAFARWLGSPEFRRYAKQRQKNIQAFARELEAQGVTIRGEGNAPFIFVDPRYVFGVRARKIVDTLEHMGFLAPLNSARVRRDEERKLSSGLRTRKGLKGVILLRVGVTMPTILGMKEPEMSLLADLFVRALQNIDPAGKIKSRPKAAKIWKGMRELMARFPTNSIGNGLTVGQAIQRIKKIMRGGHISSVNFTRDGYFLTLNRGFLTEDAIGRNVETMAERSSRRKVDLRLNGTTLEVIPTPPTIPAKLNNPAESATGLEEEKSLPQVGDVLQHKNGSMFWVLERDENSALIAPLAMDAVEYQSGMDRIGAEQMERFYKIQPSHLISPDTGVEVKEAVRLLREEFDRHSKVDYKPTPDDPVITGIYFSRSLRGSQKPRFVGKGERRDEERLGFLIKDSLSSAESRVVVLKVGPRIVVCPVTAGSPLFSVAFNFVEDKKIVPQPAQFCAIQSLLDKEVNPDSLAQARARGTPVFLYATTRKELDQFADLQLQQRTHYDIVVPSPVSNEEMATDLIRNELMQGRITLVGIAVEDSFVPVEGESGLPFPSWSNKDEKLIVTGNVEVHEGEKSPEDYREKAVRRETGGPSESAARVIAQLSRSFDPNRVMGLKISHVAQVGNDEAGQGLMESLSKLGIDVSGMQVVNGALSATTLVLVRPNGNSVFNHVRGASDFLTGQTVRPIHYEGQIFGIHGAELAEKFMPEVLSVLRQAKAARNIVTWDTVVDPFHHWANFSDGDFREILSLIDVFIPSVGEAQAIIQWREGLTEKQAAALSPEEIIQYFIDRGSRAVFLKLGKEGSSVRTLKSSVFGVETSLHLPILQGLNIIDETGMGDAYAGAVIKGILMGWSVQKITLVATATAGLVGENYGGTLDSPTTQRGLVDVLTAAEWLKAQPDVQDALKVKPSNLKELQGTIPDPVEQKTAEQYLRNLVAQYLAVAKNEGSQGLILTLWAEKSETNQSIQIEIPKTSRLATIQALLQELFLRLSEAGVQLDQSSIGQLQPKETWSHPWIEGHPPWRQLTFTILDTPPAAKTGLEEQEEYSTIRIPSHPSGLREEANSGLEEPGQQQLSLEEAAEKHMSAYLLDAVTASLMPLHPDPRTHFIVVAEGVHQAQVLVEHTRVTSTHLLVLVSNEQEKQSLQPLLIPETSIFKADDFQGNWDEARAYIWAVARGLLMVEGIAEDEIYSLRTIHRTPERLLLELKERLPLDWQEAQPITQERVEEILDLYQIGV